MQIGYALVVASLMALMSIPSSGFAASQSDCSSSTADNAPARLEDGCTALLATPGLTAKARAQAYYLRGFGRSVSGKLTAAAKDYDVGLTLDPNHNRLHRHRGVVAMKQRDFNKAYYHLQRAVELYPEGPQEHVQLAHLYIKLSQREKALVSVNKAIELKNDHIWARHMRAGILLDAQRYAEAVDDTTWLMTLAPQKLEDIGTAYIFQKTLGLYASIRIRHALILAGVGRFQDGEAVITDLLKHDRSAVTHLAHGMVLSRFPNGVGAVGRGREAIAAYRSAVEADPAYGYAWRVLAVKLQRASLYEDALEANERALKTTRTPANVPHAFWERARILRAMGRTEEAVETGVTALKAAFTIVPGAVADLVGRLRKRGYWATSVTPSSLDQELIDAVTACFHDPACI